MSVYAGPVFAIVLIVLLGLAIAGCLAALRWRAQAQRDRIALRLAIQREAAFVEAARRLADAAGSSVAAVREEIERAVKVIAPEIDAVLFFEELDAQLVCVAASGARMSYFQALRFALDDDSSLLVRALRAGHRMTAATASDTQPLHPGDRFAAAIPLVLEAGRRCVLYVGASDAGVETVVDRIVSLIDQATPAYRIAFERADDRARAEYDGLTGLLTARVLRTQLTQLLEGARCRPAGRVGLLFVDTDRFKSWNDTYGHASGDALLRELAALLRASANEAGDIVARNGGDEFCVVFADAEKSSTIERAERLRATIAAADFAPLQPAGIEAPAVIISASIGVACFPLDAHTPSALLEKADEAMYHSKRTGRNAVAYFSVTGTLVRVESASSSVPDPERRRS